MKLTIDISRQDYADFNKFHFLKTKLKRTIITGILTVLVLQIFLNSAQFNLAATVISSIVCALIYLFAINRALNKTKNIPDQDGAILGKKELEFSEDKIIWKTANAEGSSAWSTVKKLEEDSHAFYLYMDSNMAMLVPKRYFNDPSEVDTFKTLVSQKIKA